ncbi:MAG: hypothetical protein J7L58_02940, partial [Thermoplasmata archaeon]|nr:hypothetical protein [Thermoplasmata archaeon]
MNVLLPVIANLFLSLIILLISINIYTVYRRKYILWFIFALFLLPALFIYTMFESLYLKNIWGILFYPLIIIVAEIAVIMAQKNLLSSLKAEEGEEYRLLLREDIALIRAFGKLANYFIGRISLLVGIKSVEEILDECIEEYPVLAGCYIGVDEKLNTGAMEAGMGEVVEGRMEEICEAFSYLIIKLIDLYAAMVPYEEIVDDMVKAIGRIDKKIARYFMPFILFKIILEPFLREAKGDELRALRLSADIKGIYIG